MESPLSLGGLRVLTLGDNDITSLPDWGMEPSWVCISPLLEENRWQHEPTSSLPLEGMLTFSPLHQFYGIWQNKEQGLQADASGCTETAGELTLSITWEKIQDFEIHREAQGDTEIHQNK